MIPASRKTNETNPMIGLDFCLNALGSGEGHCKPNVETSLSQGDKNN